LGIGVLLAKKSPDVTPHTEYAEVFDVGANALFQ
jgi:hypothetical protein